MDFEKHIVLCEVPFGGVLFINNLVPHRRFVLLFPSFSLAINFPTRCYQILRELGVKVILIFSDLCSARRANIIFFFTFFLVTRAIDLAKTRTARSLWKSSRREIRVSMDSSYLSRFHPRTSTFHQDIFPFLMTILSVMYCFLQELCDFKYHISFDWYLFLFFPYILQ